MANAIKTVSLRLPADLYDRVEVARGELPRERWLRQAVEQALSDAQGPAPGPVPALAPFPLLKRVAMPGPNVENIRSSAQAKRDVTPIPKGGQR